MNLYSLAYFSFVLILTGVVSLVLIKKEYFEDNAFFPIVIIGTGIFYRFGLKGILPLLFFVFSSLFWGKLRGAGEKRNGWQVLANGFFPFIFALKGDYYLFLASLGVSLSDTWSSEIGQKFSKYAYTLKGFEKVSPGYRGAISLWGTLGGIFGSFLISLFSLDIKAGSLIFVSSISGNLIDSLMGSFFENRVKFVNNNFINLFSSFLGAVIYIIISILL